MSEYIPINIEISCDDSDREDSDILMRIILMKKLIFNE